MSGGLLALMLVLTSCYRSDYNTTVEDDDSATLIYIIALDYDTLISFAELGDSDVDLPDTRADYCNQAFETAVIRYENSDDVQP